VPYAPAIPYLTAPGPIPQSLDFLFRKPWHSSTADYTPVPTGPSTSNAGRGQTGSFQDDVEAGLSSSNFNIERDNIEAGDSRGGLDENGRAEVQRLMKERRVTFDEARRMLMEERFGRENIGLDGRPRDKKAVMFDQFR